MSAMQTVMIVDDEEQLCRIISHKLKKEGFRTIQAHNGYDAVQAVMTEQIDLIVIDYMLPDLTGIELLHRLKEIKPGIPAIMLTAYGNVENAVQAMKLGAVDFFCKPVELAVLVDTVRAIFGNRENVSVADEIVYISRSMQGIVAILQKVMQTDASILLLGESGVGKTALARWIHRQSNRADKPFVAFNCAAIPESLMESELFGYRKGAFTGATETRAGKFGVADKGSIFLDEIGEIPLAAQAKLLHVIEEKRFMKLGSTSYESADARILAATNKDIKQLVKDKSFREDLYYRLNVVELVVPALRERLEDIPLLAQHFLQKLNQKYQKEIVFSPDACAVLGSYHWPGNIRELVNVLERVHILNRRGIIEQDEFAAHLNRKDIALQPKPEAQPLAQTMADEDVSLQQMLDQVEGKLIEQALAKTGGNQTKAAERLGISRHTLIYKLKKQKEANRGESV